MNEAEEVSRISREQALRCWQQMAAEKIVLLDAYSRDQCVEILAREFDKIFSETMENNRAAETLMKAMRAMRQGEAADS